MTLIEAIKTGKRFRPVGKKRWAYVGEFASRKHVTYAEPTDGTEGDHYLSDWVDALMMDWEVDRQPLRLWLCPKVCAKSNGVYYTSTEPKAGWVEMVEVIK